MLSLPLEGMLEGQTPVITFPRDHDAGGMIARLPGAPLVAGSLLFCLPHPHYSSFSQPGGGRQTNLGLIFRQFAHTL